MVTGDSGMVSIGGGRGGTKVTGDFRIVPVSPVGGVIVVPDELPVRSMGLLSSPPSFEAVVTSSGTSSSSSGGAREILESRVILLRSWSWASLSRLPLANLLLMMSPSAFTQRSTAPFLGL